MAKYNQTNVVGESWVRASHISINNPIIHANTVIPQMPEGIIPNEIPSVFFSEEKVVSLPDGSVVKQSVNNDNILTIAKLAFTPDVANTQVELLDGDNNPTGKYITYAEIYTILSSLYVHAATKRDEFLSRMAPPTI